MVDRSSSQARTRYNQWLAGTMLSSTSHIAESIATKSAKMMPLPGPAPRAGCDGPFSKSMGRG